MRSFAYAAWKSFLCQKKWCSRKSFLLLRSHSKASPENCFLQEVIRWYLQHAWKARIHVILYTQNFVAMWMEISGTTFEDSLIVLFFGLTASMVTSPPFIRTDQISDKRATRLKSVATVVYYVHAVLLHLTSEIRRFLIDHEYTFAELLSLRISTDVHEESEEPMGAYQNEKNRLVVQLSETLSAGTLKDARILKLQVIHDVLRKIFQPLADTLRPRGFLICFRKAMKVSPYFDSFCFDIPEETYMSAVKLGAAACQHIRCLTATDEVSDLTWGNRGGAHYMDVVLM